MRRATKGSIGEKVWTYLSERRQAGYDMTSSGVYLKSLTHFAARKRHRGPITAALVIAWVQSSRQRRSHTFAHKLQALQPFLRFWNQRDPKNELVPSEYLGPTRGRIRPISIRRKKYDS